jgi:hypothetical protein
VTEPKIAERKNQSSPIITIPKNKMIRIKAICLKRLESIVLLEVVGCI